MEKEEDRAMIFGVALKYSEPMLRSLAMFHVFTFYNVMCHFILVLQNATASIVFVSR